MHRTADLDAALRFALGRIEEQAMRSGEPLSEEQRLLLNNLPKGESMQQRVSMTTGDPIAGPEFPIRDITYERLCALAKAAHRSELELNPASLDWEFALNVCKLNHHPMSRLLLWAGIKERRPWWDRWFLVIAALLLALSSVALILLVLDKQWALWRWGAVVAGYLGVGLLMYLARRMGEHQVKQNIERCRHHSRLVNTGRY